jgi:hypothetical protein
MAIGTAAAIGLGVAGIGSALGASSQSKAASKAADTSLQVAQQNNALARDIYGQNKDILNPYVQRGNAAGGAMNALLGLGGSPAQPQTATQQGFLPNRGLDSMMAPNALSGFDGGNPFMFAGRDGFGTQGMQFGMPEQGFAQGNGLTAPTFNAPASAGTVPGVTPQQAANDAFDIFRNSTGYQFRVNEGNRALNSGWAGAGTLQSGAAMRAAQDFGQNIASQEFGNYMGYLGNQQGVGLGAGSALAGVGQNYVNTISQNNNNAGSAAANAALIRGQNNPFASALGAFGGSILGRG